MGSQEVLERSSSVENGVSLCNGSRVQHSDNVGDSGNLGVELLNDLDSYLEDIDDRLTISRMVNDSVIKGMVCAVEQEAAEKIAQKELELGKLKETLHHCCMGADDNESSACPAMCHERRIGKCGHCFIFSSVALHEWKNDSLKNLNILARGKFEKLKNEIKNIEGSTLIRRKSSNSELLALSGVLEENEPDKWTDVDRILEGLRSCPDSVCEQAEDVVLLSKLSLSEWQQERQFQAEIEGMVMKNCIYGLQDEYERKLWGHNAHNEYRSANCLERIKEISSLRQELDSISQSLSGPENGQLFSHGSLEHQRASGNHISSITSPWEGNGKHDPSIINMPENLDLQQLKHLEKEDLFNYFKAEMTKMKRHHEQNMQEMTEQNFSLKREYLKLKGSSLPVRKDKEFELLKKKIPEIIQKLDEILVENEKLPTYSQNLMSFDHMSDRLNTLLSEDYPLRESLGDKREIMCLPSQVSDASDKLPQHFLAESKLFRMVRTFKHEKQDACTETLISDDLFKFLVKEAISQIKCFRHELAFKYDVVQSLYEVILKEAATKSQSTFCMETRDSDLESMITQGLSEILFREAFKDAEEKLGNLILHHESLQIEVLEKEILLTLTIEEREKMEQEIQEAKDALGKEKVKFEVASQELDKLRVETSQQQIMLSKSGEEVQEIESKFIEALEKIELCRGETYQLRERLDSITKELQETAQEKIKLLDEIQEKNNFLLMCEARERDHQKQLDSIVVVVQKISRGITGFECLAAESIKRNDQRVENLGSQLSCLIPEAKSLRKMGSMYKQRLESRSSDLKKAEAEVDLLGDEVDALLSLLEKIYIALDHYSPILQHYPGIIEILKLVRRELNGEAIKSV